MSATVIVLLVIGIICIVLSYIISEGISEKKASQEATKIVAIGEDYQLSEPERRLIREKVSEAIADYADQIVISTEEELSAQCNEKMMALGDYAVTVCEEIETSHKEVMFLYSMLNDKQKEIIALVNDIDNKKRELKECINIINDTEKLINSAHNNTDKNAYGNSMNKKSMQEDIDAKFEEEFEAEFKEIDATEVDLDQALEDNLDNSGNINGIILELHRSGMNIIEIAKQLGLGVGEVKLVVDLYRGE